MNKKILGIEFGAEHVKVTQLSQVRDQYNVEWYEVFPISEKAYDEDGVLDPSEVKTDLEALISKRKLKRMPVALTINSLKKIVRTRDLPMSSHKELADIVKYEAEQFLPYGIEQFYVDYRVIGSSTVGQDETKVEGVKVMIAALPKEILETQMALIHNCQLKLVSVTLHTDALYSFAIKHLINETGSAIICDIGAESINTVLIDNGEFVADLSTEQGTKSILNHFGGKHGFDLSACAPLFEGRLDTHLEKVVTEVDQLYKRIERLNQFTSYEKEPLGEASLEGEKVTYKASEDIKENINEYYGGILREITRMTEFYRTRRFGAKVDRVLICGGGSHYIHLMDFLKERLDIEEILAIDEVCVVSGVEPFDLRFVVPAIGGAIGR